MLSHILLSTLIYVAAPVINIFKEFITVLPEITVSRVTVFRNWGEIVDNCKRNMTIEKQELKGVSVFAMIC